MDLHDVGRGRGGLTKALASIKSKALIISVSSDLLFPVSEQIILAQYMSNAEHFIIESNYGHDGFLVETKKINEIITQYLLSAV